MKRWAILLCLLTVDLFAQPKQSAPKDAETTAYQAVNATASNNSDKTTAHKETAKASSPHWYASSEWWLVIIATLTGFAIAYQAREMTRATNVMQGQMNEMRRQVDLASSQLRAMHETITEMSKQTSLLKEYVGHTETTANAALESAKAAKVSADIAAGVAIPKLVVDEFSTGDTGNASLSAMLQFPKINLVVKNYGQTPALLRWWSLVFSCEELPDIPVYTGPGCGIVLTKEVIQPTQPYTLTVANHWNRQEFSLDDVQAIIDRKKTLNAYGYVCYGDIFGNPLQRFKFFETALNMGDGWISWRSEFAPDPYVGTDRLPTKKAHDQPQQVNQAN